MACQTSGGHSPLPVGALLVDNGRTAIQAKLQVSQPGDRFEQEADRVAE